MTKLFSKLTVAILAFMFVSCRKPANNGEDQGGTGTVPNYTEIPGAAPISSKLMLYAVANNQSTNPFYVVLNGSYLNYSNSFYGFSTTDVVSLDKYTSTISVRPSLTARYEGYSPNKTFTASSAYKNYVNAKLLPLVDAGYVLYDYGSGTISLPNNGQLVLPPYSFGTHSGSVTFSVLAGFTAPGLTDYAVHLPCYPMADENGKRWFLNSYGLYLLSPEASDNSYFNIDFNPNVNVILRMPVPTNLANVPDSIPVWNINEKNLWQQNGFAVRAGTYYEKKITKKGYWNFAVPVNGVYTNFHLKSSTGLGLPNVSYVIKNGISEVAEGRTDANGDGLVFIPTNTDLTIDLINDHPFGFDKKIQGLSFGNFNKASEVTVTLPPRPDVITLQGSVFDCDGKAVSSGYAGLRTFIAKDEYLFPIANGKFSAARWIGAGGYIPDTLTIYNNSGTAIFSQRIVISSPGVDSNHRYNYDAKFYTCQNSTQLYCNYRIDNKSYSIEGNTGSASPELFTSLLYPNSRDTRFNLSNNGKGIRFNVWLTTDNGSTYLYPGDIIVDGAPVQWDPPSGQSEIFLYRNDVTAGGIREGWFNFYYLEANGSKHNITGNFRVKIN